MTVLKTPVSIALSLVVAATVIVVVGGNRPQSEVNRLEADTATRAARLAPETGEDTAAEIAVDAGAEAVAVATMIPMPTFTPTPIPPTPTPIPPTPTPAYQAAQPYVELTGFTHMWQTWNNCGPATLAMNLSYFGSTLGQADIKAVLRPNDDDKNVSPHEMVAFAQSQGYNAQLRANGNADLMRLLLSNGIPVLIETWLEEDPNDGLGHYRMLTGYDHAQQYWIGYDAYVSHNLLSTDGTYRGLVMPYAQTEEWWKVFNHTYLLIYTDAQAPIVEAIMGESLDPAVMWQETLAANQAAVQSNPNDAFAWFNLGSTLTEFGDYTNAAQAFDRARELGLPWRMLWYQFGPFESYYNVGRHQEVINLADATLAITNTIEELHYWRGRSLLALGNQPAAKQAFNFALTLNPSFQPAMDVMATLP